jgi:hypothetical protein
MVYYIDLLLLTTDGGEMATMKLKSCKHVFIILARNYILS